MAAAAAARPCTGPPLYTILYMHNYMEKVCLQHVFKMEQEEYTREEINWSYVEFVDNQDVLDLIEKVLTFSDIQFPCYLIVREDPGAMIIYFCMQKPGGIIALLDEAWYVFCLFLT